MSVKTLVVADESVFASQDKNVPRWLGNTILLFYRSQKMKSYNSQHILRSMPPALREEALMCSFEKVIAVLPECIKVCVCHPGLDSKPTPTLCNQGFLLHQAGLRDDRTIQGQPFGRQQYQQVGLWRGRRVPVQDDGLALCYSKGPRRSTMFGRHGV